MIKTTARLLLLTFLCSIAQTPMLIATNGKQDDGQQQTQAPWYKKVGNYISSALRQTYELRKRFGGTKTKIALGLGLSLLVLLSTALILRKVQIIPASVPLTPRELFSKIFHAVGNDATAGAAGQLKEQLPSMTVTAVDTAADAIKEKIPALSQALADNLATAVQPKIEEMTKTTLTNVQTQLNQMSQSTIRTAGETFREQVDLTVQSLKNRLVVPFVILTGLFGANILLHGYRFLRYH